MPAHSFGWNRQRPDQRDRKFTPRPDIMATLPPTVDLREKFALAPFDQGALGSCGLNAAAGNLIFDEQVEGDTTILMPSRLFMYWVTRYLEGTVYSDSGVDNRTMLKALNKYGWCDETIWPYDVTQYTTKPSAACFTQGAQRTVTAYLAVQQQLDQMKGCLAEGFPFIFGFTVYDSFESQATAATGIVTIPASTEQVLGGHDIVFCGYDDSSQMFKFRNSWGTGWGDKGYGYFPYAYATNPQLASDFWTIRKSGLVIPVNPPPPPPPGPPPVSGGYTIPQIDASFGRAKAQVRNRQVLAVINSVNKFVDADLQAKPGAEPNAFLLFGAEEEG